VPVVAADALAILSEVCFVVFNFLQSLLTSAGVLPYFLDHETHKDFGWQMWGKYILHWKPHFTNTHLRKWQ
jgi:hypothetical protein